MENKHYTEIHGQIGIYDMEGNHCWEPYELEGYEFDEKNLPSKKEIFECLDSYCIETGIDPEEDAVCFEIVKSETDGLVTYYAEPLLTIYAAKKNGEWKTIK